MTNVPISEELGFDISQALSGIGQIDDALSQVVTQFQVGLASALETLTSAGADVQPLAESLDVAGLGPAIDTALAEAGSAPIDVTVDADTAPLTEAIDAATAVSPILDVSADTSRAEAAVEAIVAEPVELTVEANTDPAQQAIGDLGGTAGAAASGLDQLSGGVEALSASTGLAKGEVGALGGFISNISPASAEAVTGLAAVAAIVGTSTSLAADAEAQNKRFADTFGDLAEQVRQVDVGGLAISMEDLGHQSGTASADLEATASRIGQLGNTSGAARAQVASTTETLLALGATVSVNNPRLGDAAEVTDRLSNALGRGGRGLSAFGIGLTSAQITAEALRQTGKSTTDELTQFDKITAGATLAAAQFGDTLGTKFTAGAQNAQVQLRALKTQVEESLVAVGGPLLTPLIESLTDLVPVAEQVGIVLGDLAQIALPALSAVAPALGLIAPPLALIGEGLGTIGSLGTPAILAIGGLGVAAALAQVPFFGLVGAAEAFGIALDVALGPVGIAIGALAALGAITHFYGDTAEESTTDTTALADAFTVTSDAAGGLTDSISGASATVDAFLRTQLALKTEGISGTKILSEFGATFSDLDTALTGPTDALDKFLASLRLSHDPTEKERAAVKEFSQVVSDARDRLESNAKATLEAAVASGTLADADQRAVLQRTRASDGTLDYVSTLKELSPAIDAATQAVNDNAAALSTSSPAYAQLVEQFATGAITTDTFTSSLEQFGFVGTGAADQAKLVSDSLTNLISSAEGALPTVGSAIDQFASTVKTDFQRVADDIHNGTGNVQADLKKLADDQDPARFAENLATQAAQIAGFAGSLASLVAQGFGTLAAQLAQKGPEAAAGLAAALASDPAKAQVAQSSLVLRDTAVSNLDLLLRQKFPQLEGLGGEIGAQVNKGIVGTLGKDGSIQTSILKLSPEFVKAQGGGPKVEVPKPDVEGAKIAGEQTGTAAQTGFTTTFKPAAAATLAVQQVPPAIVTGMQPSNQAALQAGIDVTNAFAGQLHFGGQVSKNLESIPDRIARAEGTNNLAAAGAGFELGIAYGEGFAGGISGAIGIAATAAAELALAADAAARKALGVKSPSTAGQDLGRQYVAGVVQGLSELDPLHAATAALTLALVPDLRPALRQTPSLAPGIVAASPTPAARLAGASTSADAPASNPADRRVEATITLNKTDPDPKHFADELAWMLQ